MASNECRPLAAISNLSTRSMQSSNPIDSHKFEQLAVTEKEPYGSTTRPAKDEMSPSIYVTVIETAQGYGSYGSYGMTTVPCYEMDMDAKIVEVHEEDGIFKGSGSGYDVTDRRDEELDTSEEIVLEESGKDSCTETHWHIEHASLYRDLLACNDDFILPFESAARDVGEDVWSTAATICDEDQDDLYAALAESSWT